MSYSVSDICIYPIKSIKGLSLQSCQVNMDGLLADRRYMIVTPTGEFVTGREHPTLTLISATQISGSSWTLSHPSQSTPITLDPRLFQDEQYQVTIWDDTLLGQGCGLEIDNWLSEILATPVKLVYFSNQSTRVTSRRPDKPVAFADGYPFLLTTQASLDELNKTCPEHVQMAQFRPNIVVEGNNAFEEDTWKRIKIGEIIFENVKPCERCIFITVNPDTGERMPKGEPMKTLGKFRLDGKNGIKFGINLIAENTGQIKTGDKVEILEYQESIQFVDRRK